MKRILAADERGSVKIRAIRVICVLNRDVVAVSYNVTDMAELCALCGDIKRSFFR